jgi:tRNA splicing endonuclease
MNALKMKHVKQLMELLNVKNASELLSYISSCFETKKVLFSELDETMQKAVLTQKEYANDEIVELNDYDQNKYWKFVSSCIQLSEGIGEVEADDKIESINDLYKFGAEFQNEIIKLQTIVSPNEITTN